MAKWISFKKYGEPSSHLITRGVHRYTFYLLVGMLPRRRGFSESYLVINEDGDETGISVNAVDLELSVETEFSTPTQEEIDTYIMLGYTFCMSKL